MKEHLHRSWGDCSICTRVAEQAGGPESNLQHPHKKPGILEYAWNSSTSKARQEDPWSLLVGHFRQIGELRVQWNTLCQKIRQKTPDTNLWHTHTTTSHVHIQQQMPGSQKHLEWCWTRAYPGRYINIVITSLLGPSCHWGHLRLGGLCCLRFWSQQRKATCFLLLVMERNHAVLKVNTANSGHDRSRPSKLTGNKSYSCCWSPSLKPWSSTCHKTKKPYCRLSLFFCFYYRRRNDQSSPFFLFLERAKT